MSDSRETGPRAEAESTQPGSRINPIVFFGSSAAIVAIAVWAIISPGGAAAVLGVVVGWISEWFGWFYILVATVFLAFVIFLALSRYGKTKLGPEHSEPEFSTFSWAAMLFAAGIGTDVMFFAVAEPVTQYLAPPVGEGETLQAAREATVWTLFHYGITGWGMYALMGIALAYFAYRMNLPLSIRSTLYPVFGNRIYGPLGHGVDLAAVLGTIFGIATSLGIGVVFLNYGLNTLFSIPEGLGAQIGLIVLAVAIATVSAVSGVERGIRRLSELNVWLTLGLAAFVLVAGQTVFLLNAVVLNIGDYVSSFPGLTMQTFAFDPPTEWLGFWTLFFWAWWIAWASFVGLFLARISRGRTIRQFVAGTLTIPFVYILMWVSIFGNSAIDLIRSGNEQFGQTTINAPQQGFYTLLEQYPAFPLIASIATFCGLLFYVTSADSGALVMANLTSYRKTPRDDASSWVRIFWAVATGLLTVAMLIVGGITALQSATIVMGLPFGFVMVLLMFGLFKALRVEAIREDSRRYSLPARFSGRSMSLNGDRTAALSWRQRLRRSMSFPSREKAILFLNEVAHPALTEVAEELRMHGVEAEVRESKNEEGFTCVELVADLVEEEAPFQYRIEPQEVPMPVYGDSSLREGDTYYRLNVHLREGGQGYDVMGYTHSQLIDDVLDHYEQHVEFVRLNTGSARRQ
ncbi:bcct: transporter, betaine/carnitine/choline transporter (BCCT) family [Rubrobacter radiotolerans]|uniref:Bcct: transporter, betaine/carnitine/choline transporter (BCCT) family n=1 Tax=Rubrobacter radiotolerans TaxID=42256 RepID=A0A023X597_RUBRA|nr:choline BCCT transporter BetT [Rubrobacter radiotolerans]AHY47391.1 bcct: transporter, betaine/carnitine/choline transporter (BCCT) family [Rubrobacter radiotolerans]MDX5894794.1 choline BCCT transporter BetT [Rubrobacter radiotolerans]SMC06776.1 choline/glycine/proline betaine transport protein [Rubrobacter radiotolerans DSM 5868]